MTPERPPALTIEHVALEDGAAVIALHGRLDDSSVGELRSTLCLLGMVFGAVIVDLSHQGSFGASGIAALHDAHRRLRAAHGRLTLRGTSSHLRRMLSITGLDRVLAIEQTPDGADHPVSPPLSRREGSSGGGR
jgi:anti-sigma B factor antagonist